LNYKRKGNSKQLRFKSKRN